MFLEVLPEVRLSEGNVMTEASWGSSTKNPSIDWRMSASLHDVSRGVDQMPEVTSLEGAVLAWLELDALHRAVARLVPERAVQIDGVSTPLFTGEGIGVLAERIPTGQD